MQRTDFDYSLPPHLIAQRPLLQRSGSRLLVLDGATGVMQDQNFKDIAELIQPNDLLVFNDTRVVPARLFGAKLTGGQVEVMIERIQGERCALAHVRASKSPRPGSRLCLEGSIDVEVIGRQDDLFELEFHDARSLIEILDENGHMPLPPYIDRADEIDDRERYQTVYAREPGAVAAPTAGLHFDEVMLEGLRARGVDFGFVTLHVGAGTFQPVRVDDIKDHSMHAEYINVSQAVCDQVAAARQRGGRVIAVGTTAVRCLESAAQGGELQPYAGDTRLFITPGCQFRVVDRLITNFHLPESTLLMLVSAFAGYANIKAAYEHAVAEEYRFFSYGDAMFIAPDSSALTDRN